MKKGTLSHQKHQHKKHRFKRNHAAATKTIASIVSNISVGKKQTITNLI